MATKRKPIEPALVRYSKREKAHVYYASKPTGGMLAYFFEEIRWPDKKNLIQELDDRGYDVTTLRLTCRRKGTASK